MSEDQHIPAIEMRGVSVGAMRDASFTVVEDVDWTVAPGEFWVIAGQQHSGKSDFLMMAAGLMPPVNGSFKFFGTEVEMFDEARLTDRLRLGFVFENGQLFNQLTIAENIALPLRYHKNLAAAETSRGVEGLLELMELAPLADVTPANVSANWLQRAALARALALKPEVLLLDNPFGELDARHLQWWLRFLEQLSRGHEHFDGKPMTIVATADDLRPWQNAQRKFALLRGKKFIPLGAWNEVAAANDPVVKELLAVPVELAS